MNEIITKESIRDLMAFEASTDDIVYAEIIYDEISNYLDTYDESTNFRYGSYDINAKPISNAIYRIFNMLEEYLNEIYFYKVRFNLLIKPITVFYTFFNMSYIFTHSGPRSTVVDSLTDNEIVDIFIDAMSYAGIDELIEDILDNESIELEYSFKEVIVQLLFENIDIVRNDIESIISINKGFFNLLSTIINVSDDLFILLNKCTMNGRYNNVDLGKVININPYDLVKYGKEYLVDIISLRVLLVIPDERVKDVGKNIIYELQ